MSEDQADTVEAETDTEATPEIIQQAKDMGWVPPDNWKGNPPKGGFLTPQEYVRRGEKIMPIVRAENGKLKEEVARLRAERETDKAEHAKTISRIERMSTLALDQQRAQIEDKYASRKEAAVEVGDKAAYQQAVKDEKEATKALDERLKESDEPADKDKGGKGKVPELPKPIQDTIDAWKADNRWYDDNDSTDDMTAYANARHARLLKEKKGLSLKENLDQVAADVRKRFPEQFGGGDDEGADDTDGKPVLRGSRVEGGSRTGGGGSASLWSKLPADAKAQADKFIKEDSLFLEKGETAEKNLSAARERYAKQYLGDDK
jgi:hypothetical protein